MEENSKNQNLLVNGMVCKTKGQDSETLLELALRTKIPIHHSCGGMGTCGTCRVIITKGGELLPPPNEVEIEMIKDRGFEHQERLACQIPATPGVEVEVPLKVKTG